jgi:putative endonuclease
MNWVVYILLCGDNSLYTGITKDLENRFDKHQRGSGAKYTRGRGPLECVYVKIMKDKSSALKEEYRIKQLTKKKKLELIEGYSVNNSIL